MERCVWGKAMRIFEAHGQFSNFQTVLLNVNGIPDVKCSSLNTKYSHHAWKIAKQTVRLSTWQAFVCSLIFSRKANISDFYLIHLPKRICKLSTDSLHR